MTTPQDVPASVGWMTVTAKGITALADSIDPGDAPDARPMRGKVTFTPHTSRVLVAITEDPVEFISMDSFTCSFDENGVLRPPKDGSDSAVNGAFGGIDPDGNVSMVAPDQPTVLSEFGWDWIADFGSTGGQQWGKFKVAFGGKPNDTINLAEKYLEDKAASAGAFSPMIHPVPGPYNPLTDPLPEGIKPGMYVLDESSGDIYLVADDSSVGFFANIKGDSGDLGPSIDSGSALGALDFSELVLYSQVIDVIAEGNLTLAVEDMPTIPPSKAGSFTVRITQDGTGSRTFATTGIAWPYGVVPVLTSDPGAVDILTFLGNASGWTGFVSGQAVEVPA